MRIGFVLLGFMFLVSLVPFGSAGAAGTYGMLSPQVKEFSSYDLIHNGQLLFKSAYHPKPLKLYYAEKFIPAVSRNYEIRLPYVLPNSFKYSCQMFRHDGYYFITTDISCYS